KHEFDNYWGPRMELVFRMALILLVEANERLVIADPSGGRDRQYTILEVPRVLEDDLLRGRLLAALPDPQIRAMWRTYFTPLGHQAALPTDQRRHVALLVDEFHALPAANYEAFLAELAKYGASLVLATQSLGALDTVDPQRGLRNTVFANVDHLFAFNCSAEDARSLALELGAPIEPADLVELGDYQCY